MAHEYREPKTYVQTLVPQQSLNEVEISIAKLNRYKSLDIDLISPELIQACGRTHSEINKLMAFIWSKE